MIAGFASRCCIEFMTDPTSQPQSIRTTKRRLRKRQADATEIVQAKQLLQQLGQWYPRLFGPKLLPLKRGIFHDLLAARGPALNEETLKIALAFHTRSTRYLSAIAAGQPRYNLEGQAVEAVAPEHVYWALHTTFRRRQQRTPNEDITPQLCSRIARAFQSSGLTREAYTALVDNRNEQITALLERALTQATEQDAKAEALLRAYEASGCQDIAQFADMYGLDPRATAGQLHRARQVRDIHVAQTTDTCAMAA